jgi:glycosyltransferase involved in cell wall biosynthesis
VKDWKDMKICFFTGEFYNPKTGGEVYNKALIEAAQRSGWDVKIFELYHSREKTTHVLNANLSVLKQIMQLTSDTILMFDFGHLPSFTLGILFSRMFKKNTIIGLLHHYAYHDARRVRAKILHRSAANLLSSKIDVLFTNSTFSIDSFKGHTEKKIPAYRVAPFVADKTQPQFMENRFSGSVTKFLHVGTLQKRKNLHMTLRALAKLNGDFVFDIVGGWDNEQYTQELLELIESLGLANKVKFHGRLEDQALSNMFEQATIFIMVSQLEGYGMVYTEAMKHGLPIIASDRGAIPEVVTLDENGILCNPDDEQSIYTAITRLLSNKERLKTMSRTNYEKYKTFTDRESFVTQYRINFSAVRGTSGRVQV